MCHIIPNCGPKTKHTGKPVLFALTGSCFPNLLGDTVLEWGPLDKQNPARTV